MVDKAVIDTILGEAGGKTRAERYADMLAIASVIANRAELANTTPESIVSAKGQFGAYGKSLPDGTEDLRDLAESAWSYVEQNGPVNNATYYSKPSSTGNLPGGLKQESATVAHEYYSDPQNRSFLTADGYVKPAAPAAPAVLSPNMAPAALPYSDIVPPTVAPSTSLPAAPTTNHVSYAHPERGDWSRNLSPEVVDSVNMLSAAMPGGVAITSAWRSANNPAEAAKARPGQHFHGRAYDLDLSGLTADQRARAVEYAAMSGATRMGTYTKSPNMLHVDFAKGFPPTYGTVYAMHDRTRHQMENAPGWFTKGLTQVSVPTPTPRPDTLAAPVGPVTRAPLPDLPGPAMGARAAAGLQGIDQPAYGARAASELQSYKGTPQATGALPAPAPAPALNAPRSITDRPVAAPPLPSIVNPPTTMSRPSLPAAVPPASVKTSSVPLASIGSFPEAPMDPGRKARTEAAKGALLGLATGGLPGAILGGLLGPAKAQIGRNIAARQNPFSNIFSSYRGMFGDLGRLSSIPAPNYGATPYSVGSGYGAIGSVFGAPAGATALSRSNPEVSFTSLGNGYVSRSNSQYGTSYTMGPGEYDAGMFGGGGKSGGKGGKK